MIRIVIGEHLPIVREGIRRVLEAVAGVTICAEASDGRAVLDCVSEQTPEIVIVDSCAPRLNGIDVLERVRNQSPHTKVIFYATHCDDALIEAAVRRGANAFVLKTEAASEIVAAVHAVMQDQTYYSPAVSKQISAALRNPEKETPEPFSLLSTREREILQLIAEGFSAKEIASDLKISPKTVEAHRTSVMRKIGARKATELVRYAIRNKLIAA